MLLCALVLGAWVSPLRADPDGAIDLRVMSFNIRVLNTSDAAENQWTNRADNVCALITSCSPMCSACKRLCRSNTKMSRPAWTGT